MRLIAHRGNIRGKTDKEHDYIENGPSFILEALAEGYDCEIDVWYVNNKFYLGHDKAEYLVIEEFLLLPGLWLHCKNVEALLRLKEMKVNSFWHQNDDYAILLANACWNKNLVWTCKYENNPNVIIMDTTGQFLESLKKDEPLRIYGYCCNDLRPMKRYLESKTDNINLASSSTVHGAVWFPRTNQAVTIVDPNTQSSF